MTPARAECLRGRELVEDAVVTDTFFDLVQAVYLALPETLTDAFEQIGGIAVQWAYQQSAVPVGTQILGLWVPWLRTVFLYEQPTLTMNEQRRRQHVDDVLRHEIGHALGLDHAELGELHL